MFTKTRIIRRPRRGPVAVATTLAVAALVASAAPALADTRLASKGWYTEAGVGATAMLGPAADASKVGAALAMRAGYDLFSWFSVGLHLGASTHEATVPPPPEGEYYQLYHVGADARLGVQFRSVALFAEGGVGLGAVSSNILAKVQILEPGESFSLALTAGGGLEYQLRNRHYAVGVGAQWVSLPGFAQTQGVTSRAFLRYTY